MALPEHAHHVRCKKRIHIDSDKETHDVHKPFNTVLFYNLCAKDGVGAKKAPVCIAPRQRASQNGNTT